MSTLVLVLAAAMAVPGNGPEMLSGETERGLDLSGEWEGRWKTDKAEYEVELLGEKGGCSYRRLPRGKCWGYLTPDITDQGEGRLRLTWEDDPCLGIYEQDGDCLTICFRDAREGRPLSFRVGDGQHLLILHRVKPRK
ncbi:MAG TPA: hypothetical protein VH643_15900 [Gemmataceae bacterium]|jgi:hypothetical protein